MTTTSPEQGRPADRSAKLSPQNLALIKANSAVPFWVDFDFGPTRMHAGVLNDLLDAARLSALPSQAPGEGVWRPIAETKGQPKFGCLLFSPNNGHADLGSGHDYSMTVGFWDGSGFCEQGTAHSITDEYEPEHQPTHFMPLPPPPSPEAEGGS